MSNDDTSTLLPSPGLDPSIVIDSREKAWQRLIARAVPLDELPSLIETVFSGKETNIVYRLKGSDAQAFIDIMDEVHHRTPLSPRNVQLTSLSSTFFCSGSERTQSCIAYPKEMRENVVQDVCSPRSVSEIIKD